MKTSTVVSLFTRPSAHLCDDDLLSESGACFSDDRRFRYNLWRSWQSGPAITFLMLNPSLADEHTLDPTLRRCFDFSRRLGYGTMFISNVFPIVSPYPKKLLTENDRDGEQGRNIEHIRHNLSRSVGLLLGFGNWPMRSELRYALRAIEDVITEMKIVPQALEINKDGSPRHPLYIRNNTLPRDYTFR